MTGITRQNIFKLKRSNVSGKMPTTSDLLVGELAVNTQDGFLYSSIANTGGTNTIEVRQIGWDRLSTISGGTINGDVIVNGSLSATTYLGLPLDVYVTGGTYSNGTLTLNRQNGSTSVSNFFTGFTLSDGTNTQSISNGDVLLVSVGSGLTSTVSATDRVTINLNITGTTAEASPANGDKLLIFDASSGTHRNIDWSQLPGLTFSGTSNYYSRFTSGGTLSNGSIWDDGISIVNFMGTEDTAINIVSPVGYYYPSLSFYNNGVTLIGSITGYNNELYINGGLKEHPNYINLPYHTPFTLLYTNANNYVLPVTIGSNLSFTGGTLSVTGLTSGMIFTGGTVTGSTNFTNGVTANTYTVNQLYGLTAQTAQTVNLELTDQYEYTLTGNTTFTFSNNLNGKSWMVAVKSNPTTSGYTSSFTASTANVKWAYGITPVQTATANKTDIYSFIQLNGVIYGDYSQSY